VFNTTSKETIFHSKMDVNNVEATQMFIELLKFRTVSADGPINGSYDACGQWILNELISMGLEAEILKESKSHKPIIVGRMLGSNPLLPVILLNSHYDVVPG
jgi:acetylornithine deacetylase/succinyl-diaminopimelate desuccinylase-like protein